MEDGYVDTAVWKRLQKYVTAEVLPTFSERRELRKRSRSSESLSSDFNPEASVFAVSTAEDSSALLPVILDGK